MGWFRDRTGTGRNRAPSSMLTAAGMRIDLQDRNVINRIAATKMNWQHQAWNYRDLVGEMAAALRFRGNAMAKVALVIGQVNDREDEPIRMDAENCTLEPAVATAAQDALNRLPWRNGHAFAAVLDTCFSVTGEAWLHGKPDEQGDEVWTVRSTDEIQPVAGASNLGVVEVPGRPAIPIDKDREALLRLWVPHPRFKMLADSPLRSMLDVCEDIVLIGRELRAAARSRIAANGVWMVPYGMSLVRREPGANESDPEADPFAADLAAAMLAPIANEGDAGAVVPIVIRGDAEDIEAAAKGHITFERETSSGLMEKLNNGLKRMGETLDIPPTVVTGLQDTNHWNAYVIDAQTWTNHLEPGMRLQVDSITEAYLRPILAMPVTEGGYGLTLQQAQTVQVWYDAGKVTENANRSSDAQAAFTLGVIGPKTVRRDMGYEESDAPTEDELRVMLAFKVNPDPATAGALVSQALGIPQVVPAAPGAPQPVNGKTPATQQVSPPPPRRALPQAQAPVPTSTSTGAPPAPAGVRVAAAHPQGVLDSVRLVTGDDLVEIDRHLRDRLMVACDDAVMAAVEKAAHRIASAAQHKVNREILADHRGVDLAVFLGPERVAELGVVQDALLAAAFTYLSEQFAKWCLQAIKASLQLASLSYGLPLAAVAELTRTLTRRIPTGWNRLEHSLRTRALNRLYGRHGTEDHVGEVVDSIVMPGDIRSALAVVGGEPRAGVSDDGRAHGDQPLGGIATGTDLHGAISLRADEIGFQWRYGITPRQKAFEPHHALDGRRFSGWDDKRLATDTATAWLGEVLRPGDHAGCMCDYVPVWAIPDEVQRLETGEPESPAMQNERLLADLDKAAGRTGTTAQRSVAQRERILAAQQRWLANARSGA